MPNGEPGREWTPEQFRAEVDRVVAELLAIPGPEKLAYLKKRMATFQGQYRVAAETLILQREQLMQNDPPSGQLAFVKEAIQAVPAVKYALGVGGVVVIIAIVSSFGINYRVATIGFPIALVMMILLLIFAKLATVKPEGFLTPFVVMTWFSIIAMAATVFFIMSGVFFKWPLDLHTWLTRG